MKTVIGLFDTTEDAYSAQNELLAAGVGRLQISVITSQANRDYAHPVSSAEQTQTADAAGAGAAAGAVAGGAAGILASLGLLAIPGIGWLLGTGVLATALAGAGIGVVAGGLIGGLIGLGIPEHEAEVYEEGVRRGGVLVTVDSAEKDSDRVAMILSQHHAIDIDRRVVEWETAGWARRYQPPVTPPPITPVEPRSRGTGKPPDQNLSPPGNAPVSRRTTSARIYNP